MTNLFWMNNQFEKVVIEAIIFFEKKANEVIQLLVANFNLDLTDEHPFSLLLTRENNLWTGKIKDGWKYRFHGSSCEFYNENTGQILDVYINKNKHFGALDYYFLYRFIETTKELDYVMSKLKTKENFRKAIKELEKSNFIIDIGVENFPIRVLNYKLINKDN